MTYWYAPGAGCRFVLSYFRLGVGVGWVVTSGLGAVGLLLRFPGCWVVGGTGFNTAFILPVGSLSVVPVASALRGIYFFYSNL